MNNVPRETLRRILAKYGREICGDARRCEGLLNDLCGFYRREINVLVNAVEERVPLDLLAASGSMPRELLLNKLEKRLEDQLGLTGEAARWAVESWALALDVASETEIQERQRKVEIEESRRKQNNSNQPLRETRPNQPTDSPLNGKTANANQFNPVNPVPASKPPRTFPPPIRPPQTVNQPVGKPIPASPPVIPRTSNQPPGNSPAPTANQSIPKKRSFGVFRGCLIVIFLIITASIVFLFGVPYAVEVMRETQRQRNNEPPRFPGG